jgi:hypothetical protein
MDPDANWDEQVRIAARLSGGDEPSHMTDAELRERSRELQRELRAWIRNGGFKPAAWSR